MSPVRLVVAMLVLVLSAPFASAQLRGGTAVVAVPSDPGHLNPAITTSAPVQQIAGSIFNGLISLDETGTPRPDLAQSWTIAPDGLRVTFTLVPDARWHDGQPVTAEDVKFTFENLLFRFHARTRAGLAPAVESIDAPEARTVVFRLRRPHAPLLRQLDVLEAPILPRHVYAEGDANQHPANLRPVGSGPFRFESYRQDDSVVLVRNPAYFKAGLPHLDRLVFRVIPDANTQIQALLAGEVDYLVRVAASDVRRLQNRGITLVDTRGGAGGSNCIMTLAFNLERPTLADLRVRRAIAAAMDRNQMLDLILFGRGRVAEAPISSGIPWAHLPGALAAHPIDPALANRLLDEAGHPRGANGERFSIDMFLYATFTRYAELMRQQLAQVGIGLRARFVDAAGLGEAVFARRYFDTTLVSYCNGLDPAIGVRRMYDSTNIGSVPFSNAAAFRNAEVDRHFAAAGATMDEAVRGEHYRAAQRILAAELPYWWLVEANLTTAWRDAFRGFAPWSGSFAEGAQRLR
ncbi:ABC transporter substrate-binding protein [Falsiroseomonas oryzae]|uniref:ABC transporter substrate-binding protein n=1 Tax=Falsiroseomonas oryzae TaxID=2766473 RepID=UPI0022EAF4AF|nr:ABC transporter substrate-binding protein [Roseomonas sp. MO-31]